MLFHLYDRIGDPNDLEEAISKVDMAVSMTPEDHPDWPGRLNNLGTMLLSRCELTGKSDYLEKAILKTEKAASITREDHPDRAGILNSLGSMLLSRYCEGLPGVYSTIWCLCYKTNKLKKRKETRATARAK
jgi:hypothetical protein